MRYLKHVLPVVVIGAIVGSQVMAWRAQRETQRKLEALAAVLAASPPEITPSVPEQPQVAFPQPGVVPRELEKGSLSPYVIEAPDSLLVEVAVRDPKSNQTQTLPVQPVSGPFLVRPDGSIGLGIWGSAVVAGRTLEQAADQIRQRLADQDALKSAGIRRDDLVVSVDVQAINSKRYYVIVSSGESGDQIFTFPASGSDTVLDAMANVHGLPGPECSVRLLRKQKHGMPDAVLPVDWKAISQDNSTRTNYQILPGDRLYVSAK